MMIRRLLAVVVAALAMLIGIQAAAPPSSSTTDVVALPDGVPAEDVCDCETEALLEPPRSLGEIAHDPLGFGTPSPAPPARVDLEREEPPPRREA